MKANTIELDVREDIKKGNDPFRVIMETITTFKNGDTLILHAPFQPVPLYNVLAAKEFEHETQKINDNHYKVIFIKKEK
ncbi:DUF2249 domain-containing protein [Mesobacillus maritimus]|uniref:DUF2249 domain-containing protein n=1 Tax=Mesobacillus maritimus TaxID=1643336 RepID=UPI00203DBD1E|nr:DUF2249 domain-containing protein [Mesobacillus maritimus]MCM3588767.1 DUF2249 domain-containing protein [Mesobacillus maritimus]MCM3669415.1 DUF2249 domain-containing protein [Mesobacillus maritimus]